MLIDLMGALATGFGLMGLVLMVNRLVLRGALGRWIYPASVAAGMILYTVWAEYTWADRTIDALPQLTLVSEDGDAVPYRPWTYLWPQTTRMVAIDLSQTRTHPQQPGLVMTRIVLIGRWQPMRAVTVVYDCADHRRADLREGVELNADGTLEGADWTSLDAEDAALRAACSVVEEEPDEQGSGA
ncbi:hypothetical protein JI664_10405 [Rhodobacter sp. NTK016B]|uniref:hypothetical protein n=1 Tax=Rhodobacter sp. NTK016B TaxID=2759676 RepID=UPI001A8F572B|nr:hypothetical protein [Rhodobacter sp. NTK016B]MBN8292376.1 hypothetical protein [Rhodobacter sp. NTK016B]